MKEIINLSSAEAVGKKKSAIELPPTERQELKGLIKKFSREYETSGDSFCRLVLENLKGRDYPSRISAQVFNRWRGIMDSIIDELGAEEDWQLARQIREARWLAKERLDEEAVNDEEEFQQIIKKR